MPAVADGNAGAGAGARVSPAQAANGRATPQSVLNGRITPLQPLNAPAANGRRTPMNAVAAASMTAAPKAQSRLSPGPGPVRTQSPAGNGKTQLNGSMKLNGSSHVAAGSGAGAGAGAGVSLQNGTARMDTTSDEEQLASKRANSPHADVVPNGVNGKAKKAAAELKQAAPAPAMPQSEHKPILDLRADEAGAGAGAGFQTSVGLLGKPRALLKKGGKMTSADATLPQVSSWRVAVCHSCIT